MKDDGGPAFPRLGDEYSMARDGMTLRDYFAGQALASVALADLGSRLAVLRESGSEDGGLTAQQIAECAYLQADAMLAERAK